MEVVRKNNLYYKKLDYIRIISCLLVLLYHLNILKGGFLAVCTFFALSGYLGCASALKDKDFSIRKYYVNRFKKIYLPLIFVVFITLIVFRICSNTIWMNLKPESSSVLFGYNNYWQLNANLDYFTKNINSPFIHLWYIAILMQFELIFPFIFKGLKKVNKKIKADISTISVLILSIISTIFFFIMSQTQDIMPVYYNTFTRIFAILWGILLALLHCKYNLKIANKFRKHNQIMFWLYAIILIVLCVFVSAEGKEYAIFMILATAISVRMIEYATMRSQKNDSKILKIISKMSYEIYLVQYPVIFLMQSLPLDNTIKTPIIIGVTIIISYMIWQFLNESFDDKKRRMIKNIAIVLVCLVGCYIIITARDYSAEMKELEEKLNVSSQMNEEKNKEYLSSIGNENNNNNNENDENINDNNETVENTQTIQNSKQLTNDENKNSDTKKEKQQENQTKNQQTNKMTEEEVKQIPLICVGDSVLLGVTDELRKVFPNSYIDGKVSRTITGGKEVLEDLNDKGKLGNILLLALANNGDYSDTKNKKLMEFLGDREVFWVDAVGADDPEFNKRFKEFAKDYPNIHIIEWEVASKNHPEYFYADGVHLKGDGIIAYVQTVYNSILKYYTKK